MTASDLLFVFVLGIGVGNLSSSDPCFPPPCKNNGVCHNNNTHGDYTCACKGPFIGKNCSMCKTAGFTGPECKDDIDECKMTPDICHKGKCKNTIGSMHCVCNNGWTGKRCDQKINMCLSKPCKNGGQCLQIHMDYDYECKCTPGYYGRDCEKYDRCRLNNLCEHGQCIENGTCVCPSKYTGERCEIEIKTEACPRNCLTATCDPLCNKPACNYSDFTCTLGVDPYRHCPVSKCRTLAGDGACEADCNNNECLFDGGDCLKKQKCPFEEFCAESFHDGQCDTKCNVPSCGYDSVDCLGEKPSIASGRIVMEVESTYDNFKTNQKIFERTLSIMLNSYITVESVKVIKKRVRRSLSNSSGDSLEVKLTMDNSKCSQCFTPQQAVRYLALKNSQNELHLPVKVGRISAEDTTEPSGELPMAPLWIVLIIAAPLVVIGVIKLSLVKVKSKLWQTENERTNEQRGSPVGQESNEMRCLQDEEILGNGLPKRRKLNHDDMSLFAPTTPFLPNNTQSTSNDEHGYEHTLHYAAAYGHEAIIRNQIDLIDVNTRDRRGRTALHIAVSAGRDPIVRLLTRSRTINIDLQDDEGNTALMGAVNLQHNDYVKDFIQLGSRVTLTNKQGKTALHIAAMVDNFYAARLLLQHNARVDAQDTQLRTPLHWAVIEDAYRTAALLVASFASRTACDIDDITPMLLAKRMRNQQMMLLLSDNGGTSPPLETIPSPAEISPPCPIRPKIATHCMPKNNVSRKRKQQNNIRHTYLPEVRNIRGWENCLGDIPDWANLPAHQPQFNHHLPEQFNFITYDTPSPCVGQSELSPFSESIPCIMTPPESFGTSSPQSIGSDEVP